MLTARMDTFSAIPCGLALVSCCAVAKQLACSVRAGSALITSDCRTGSLSYRQAACHEIYASWLPSKYEALKVRKGKQLQLGHYKESISWKQPCKVGSPKCLHAQLMPVLWSQESLTWSKNPTSSEWPHPVLMHSNKHKTIMFMHRWKDPKPMKLGSLLVEISENCTIPLNFMPDL